LLASDKRVLITAETGRALRVLKDKLPKQIQPLCVSLLGQSGDAFAELNSSVQEITKLYDAWNPGTYDRRLGDIDQELAAQRRSVAKIDAELLSLREAETALHSNWSVRGGELSADEELSFCDMLRNGSHLFPKSTSDTPAHSRR